MLDPAPKQKTKPVRVVDQVLRFLREHPDETFNTQGIMEGTGLPERSVMGGLANLHDHRSVERPSTGWWKYKPRSRGASATETAATSRLAVATEPSTEPGGARACARLSPGDILEVVDVPSPVLTAASAEDEHGGIWVVLGHVEWSYIMKHLVDVQATATTFWADWPVANPQPDCLKPAPPVASAPEPSSESDHCGEIAMYLRQLREARAYELDVLSVKSTIPEARLRSFEHGRAQPTRDQIVLLARAYRMGAKELSCFLGHGTNLYGFDEGGEDG